MKNTLIIILLLAIIYTLFATDPPRKTKGSGCTSGTGHIFYAPDSIWSDTLRCHWYLDTFKYRVGDSIYDYEYLVLPDGCDTTYFTCLRCDSVGYYVSDSIQIMVRDVTER